GRFRSRPNRIRKRLPKLPAGSRGSTGCESRGPMKAPSRPFDPAVTLREAVALHQQGRLREAQPIYTRLLQAAPDLFDALNLPGGIKMQQGQFGGAQRLFGAAVTANPRIAAAWGNLGQAQHALKRPAEALASLDQARGLAADDVDILYQH